MELIQATAEHAPLAEAPLDDRLAFEARTSAEAFARLYERHVERIYRYLRARGATDDDAAELASITFERALVHINRHRPGNSGFGAWLVGIARNAFVDATRRHANRSVGLADAGDVAASEISPEETVIAAEERERILAFVARHPDVQRDALALRFAAGLSSREIATVIVKSGSATKKLLTRSLAVLREAISAGASLALSLSSLRSQSAWTSLISCSGVKPGRHLPDCPTRAVHPSPPGPGKSSTPGSAARIRLRREWSESTKNISPTTQSSSRAFLPSLEGR